MALFLRQPGWAGNRKWSDTMAWLTSLLTNCHCFHYLNPLLVFSIYSRPMHLPYLKTFHIPLNYLLPYSLWSTSEPSSFNHIMHTFLTNSLFVKLVCTGVCVLTINIGSKICDNSKVQNYQPLNFFGGLLKSLPSRWTTHRSSTNLLMPALSITRLLQ